MEKKKPAEPESARIIHRPQTAELQEILKPFRSTTHQTSLAGFFGGGQKRKAEEEASPNDLPQLKKPRTSLPGQ